MAIVYKKRVLCFKWQNYPNILLKLVLTLSSEELKLLFLFFKWSIEIQTMVCLCGTA